MTDAAGISSPPETGATAESGRRPGALRRRLTGDSYTIVAWSIFLFIILTNWRAHLDTHEMIYMLGPRRVADPGFLAVDFTWSRLPPTSALFDHLMAPLWSWWGVFSIAVGRFVSWAVLAWSIAFLGRTTRLPAWSVFAGFAFWMLWGQTLASCGSPLEGFQVKTFSYPLMFFALAFALRGQMALAGLASGLATALHIIVGGWACLALFLSMLFDRKQFPPRRLAIFLLCTAPFIVPLMVGVGLFHRATSGAERALMDKIYVTFAMPHCCDVDSYMTPMRWVRAVIVFAIAPMLIFSWPHGRVARILGGFVVALMLFFAAGVLAQRLGLYGLLKLYPGQLATSIPALFLFMFVAAWFVTGPIRRFGRVAWSLMILGTLWLGYNREIAEIIMETPGEFVYQAWRREWPKPRDNEPLYAWIRKNTPRNSVFITPFLSDFWPFAERAQVASMRHPPLDRRIIEWKTRLEALNQFRPFTRRGFDINDSMEVSEANLSIAVLARIRDAYGATHYLIRGERKDLADYFLYSANGYSIYDVAGMTGARRPIASFRIPAADSRPPLNPTASSRTPAASSRRRSHPYGSARLARWS